MALYVLYQVTKLVAIWFSCLHCIALGSRCLPFCDQCGNYGREMASCVHQDDHDEKEDDLIKREADQHTIVFMTFCLL